MTICDHCSARMKTWRLVRGKRYCGLQCATDAARERRRLREDARPKQLPLLPLPRYRPRPLEITEEEFDALVADLKERDPRP